MIQVSNISGELMKKDSFIRSALHTGTITAGIICFSNLAQAEGASPWLAAPGQLSFGISYTAQSADNAYIGDQELSISAITNGGAGEYEIDTTALRINYGLADSLAIDAAVAYTEVEAGAADSDSGLGDSKIGIQWRVVDEYINDGWPSIAVTSSLIIAGDYESDRLAALGKAENGLEFSTVIGKQFSPVSLWAEAGLKTYEDVVPDAFFYNLNLAISISSKLGASFAYSYKEFDSDLDIGGEGFSPTRFAEVAEERSLLKAGLSYALAENQGLSLALAQVTSGRNTVKDDLIVSLAYSFGIN